MVLWKFFKQIITSVRTSGIPGACTGVFNTPTESFCLGQDVSVLWKGLWFNTRSEILSSGGYRAPVGQPVLHPLPSQLTVLTAVRFLSKQTAKLPNPNAVTDKGGAPCHIYFFSYFCFPSEIPKAWTPGCREQGGESQHRHSATWYRMCP